MCVAIRSAEQLEQTCFKTLFPPALMGLAGPAPLNAEAEHSGTSFLAKTVQPLSGKGLRVVPAEWFAGTTTEQLWKDCSGVFLCVPGVIAM